MTLRIIELLQIVNTDFIMRRFITLLPSLFCFFYLYSQDKVSVTCVNFTFSKTKNVRGSEIKKLFEQTLIDSKTIWNVVEREEMFVFLQKLQEEKNLEKDFKEVSTRPELARVDYLVIGDITLNSRLDKYKLDISFIKLRGEQVTSKLPLQVSFSKDEISDDSAVTTILTKALKDFTESHFIVNGTDWIKAPNFYNELDKRDSLISDLRKENLRVQGDLNVLKKTDSAMQHQADSIEKLKATTPNVYPFITLEKDGSLFIHLYFENNVPIRYTYYISEVGKSEMLSGILLERPTAYIKAGRILVSPAGVNINTWKLAKKALTKITFHLTYESVFNEQQRRDPMAKVDVSYILDPVQYTMVEIERKGQPVNNKFAPLYLFPYSYFIYSLYWELPNRQGMKPLPGAAFFIRQNGNLYLITSRLMMALLKNEIINPLIKFSDTMWLRIYTRDMKDGATFPVNISSIKKSLTTKDNKDFDFIVMPLHQDNADFPIYSIENYIEPVQNYDSGEVISLGFSNPELAKVGIDSFVRQQPQILEGKIVRNGLAGSQAKSENPIFSILAPASTNYAGKLGSPVFLKQQNRLIFGGVLCSGNDTLGTGCVVKADVVLSKIKEIEGLK